MASWFSFGATAQSEVWPSGLVALHAISDGIIALSFFAIPLALLYIYRRRGETNPGERMLIILFALFIFAVGLAHLASLFTLLVPGLPGRGFEGLLKALGALLALTGAVAIWRLAPHLLRLPSRDRLQAEVAAHLRTFEELKDSRHQLEERVDARTKELDEAKQRFEIALRGTPISVFSQDKDLRFTWVHNPPTGVSPDTLLGKTDAEILPPEAAEKIMAAKRKVMKTGEAQELESNFELF
ncbi:MAG TPA: PAS domain-containing protein, partial [Candidatus Limnocylindria bacterium]|nr:PAS domain-containing protein [Candidatus Limnocylindria bacterium]